MAARTFPFIHVKSAKFPVLPGEEDELVNEGTYGKALAQYLEAQLKARSYEVAFIGCEDWGWWVEIRGHPLAMGVCVYGSPDLSKTHELCVTVSPEPGRCWSWRQFRFVDTTGPAAKLFDDLREIFAADPAVEVLGYPEGFGTMNSQGELWTQKGHHPRLGFGNERCRRCARRSPCARR
jgi:hypothetical protein